MEGDSELALPSFFHKWLDPKLLNSSKAGILAIKFQGVNEYLGDLAKKVEIYLTERRANFIVGLVDLYGLPPNRIDLSQCVSTREKVVPLDVSSSISPFMRSKRGFWLIRKNGRRTFGIGSKNDHRRK